MHEIEGEPIIELALSPQVDGRVLAARAHVTYCQECAQALVTFIDQSLLAEPQTRQEPIWSWTSAKKLAIQFTQQAIAALQPRPTPGLVLRHSRAEVAYHYALEDDATGFGVDIEVEKEDGEQACVIAVTVAQSGDQRTLKLAGATVTLSWDEGKAWSEETDAMGEAIFDEVPFAALPSLLIEIEPPA